jgi:hypothetical protein
MKGIKIKDKEIVFSNPDVTLRIKRKYRDALKDHVGTEYVKCSSWSDMFFNMVVGLMFIAAMTLPCVSIAYMDNIDQPSDRRSISPGIKGAYVANQNYHAMILVVPLSPELYYGYIKKRTDSALSIQPVFLKIEDRTLIRITDDGTLLLGDRIAASYAPVSLLDRLEYDKPIGIGPCDPGPKGIRGIEEGPSSTVYPKDVYLTKMATNNYETKFVPQNCSIVTTGPNDERRFRQFSSTKQCKFKFQSDENFVVYDMNDKPLWASNTYYCDNIASKQLKLNLDSSGELFLVDGNDIRVKRIL